jgi:hypothetical protein
MFIALCGIFLSFYMCYNKVIIPFFRKTLRASFEARVAILGDGDLEKRGLKVATTKWNWQLFGGGQLID